MPASDITLELEIISAAVQDRSARGFLLSRVSPGDFSELPHKKAWQEMATGNTVYAEKLASGHDPPADISTAVSRLKALAELRKVEALSRTALKALSNGAVKRPEHFLEQFCRAASRIGLPPSGAVMLPGDWIEKGLQEACRRGMSNPVIELGIRGLSRAVLPEPGHLLIVAGQTGKGKTALALNIAYSCGIERSMPTLYVNTEMGWHELAFRLFSLMSGIPVTRIRTGEMSEHDRKILEEDARKLADEAALSITDALPWADINEVAALAREAKMRQGLKILVVDYIQRLEDRARDLESWQSLILATRVLKSLAQELNILVILLAQLNDRRQLAGSTGMLREADAAVYVEEAPEGSPTSHMLFVEKARHARSHVKIPVNINPETLRAKGLPELAGACERQEGRKKKKKKQDRAGKEETVQVGMPFTEEDWNNIPALDSWINQTS
ncbi:DnaB-like helicase C-terminal domain-containing protein [Moorellaceae bacterium AZ2]